ncbi:alpha/beta-hydrolase [Linderina pennispora]|uniref:Alpha/beta-hydrolase n=1 Tax=Linderina pennispora TaxID=61395 RepID=A0A1Y1W878_9FUNG|nr:alpha/beta-hydrolase [Linderina pennispora]ORX69719.1 alpha/beta-hydrolase [Linderina pennispora]
MDPLNPDSFNHKFATVNGTTIHYVDEGTGPVILCFHGFPDLWYGWRKQIPYLVSLGYRVIAPDTHGYGQTDAPKDLKAYGAKNIVNDFVSLLDTLNIREAVWAGHDWGGLVAWRAALWHPERVIGVISYCTPYIPTADTFTPLEDFVVKFPNWSYQLYFQRPEATDELNKEIPLFLTALFRHYKDFAKTSIFNPAVPPEQRTITDVRGLERSSVFTQGQLDYYIGEFQRKGMEGPLNAYRVRKINWEDEHEAGFLMNKIDKPSMMVTAGHDGALPAKWTEHMPKFIPDLMQEHVEESGHWILDEQPEFCNSAFAKFLKHLEDSGLIQK